MATFKFKITLDCGYSYIHEISASNKLDAFAKIKAFIKSKYASPDFIKYELTNTYKMSNIMNNYKIENIINYDYEGWTEYKKSIKDLIIAFGGVYNKETKKWEIPDSGDLNTCPILIEDDGMGYGINERYIIHVDFDRVSQICHVWHDAELKYAPIYAELGIHPGAIVKINGEEYTIEDIIVEDQEQGKIKIQAAVWDFQALEKAHKNKEKYTPKRELFDPEIIEKSVKGDIENIDSHEIE